VLEHYYGLKQETKQLRDIISALFRGSRKGNNVSRISLWILPSSTEGDGAQQALVEVVFGSATYCSKSRTNIICDAYV